MKPLFKDKVALVTGGGSGIGRTTAIELAKEGATVVVAGRTEKPCIETVRLIAEAGGKAIYIKTDVSKEEDVRRLVGKTEETFGRLDIAFNNAGVEQPPMPLDKQEEALFDQVMDINVKGVWLCMKYEIPAMLRSGGGSIVNTASFSGAIAFPTIPIYVASKHAVVGLTKSLALEYAKQGVRINAVLPGAVADTGTFDRSFGGSQASIDWAKSIHPMGRLAKPSEIADAVVFLSSEKAGFITGHSLLIDGGYTAG